MRTRDLLEQFFDAYLNKRDLEAGLTFLSEKVTSVGTGDNEVAINKEEMRILMEQEVRDIEGEIRYEIREYRETEYDEDLRGIFCRLLLVANVKERGFTSLETRFTAVAAREEGQWRFISVHMSTPEKSQEEEWLFPLKYSRRSVGTIGELAGKRLVKMMSSLLPGGVLGVYLEEDFPLYVINDALLRHLGYTYRQLEEETDERGICLIAPEDRERVRRMILDSLDERGEYEIQYRMVRRDGSYFWVLGKGNEMITEDGQRAVISVVLDISKSMGIQERLRREAMEDGLTGILNRKGAIHFIERCFEERDTGTMFLMDIDNFKNMNDTFGHLAGDEVLVTLGNILTHSMRQGDVVSRMGGDEFMVYLCGSTRRDIVEERVRTIARLFLEAGEKYKKVRLSVSTGIAFREKGESFEELYRRADHALYKVKNDRKGGYAFWEKE